MGFLTSLKSSWVDMFRGDEKLWKVWWLWGGYGAYATLIIFGGISASITYMIHLSGSARRSVALFLIFFLFLLFAFLVIRNMKNTESRIWGNLAGGLSIIFTLLMLLGAINSLFLSM